MGLVNEVAEAGLFAVGRERWEAAALVLVHVSDQVSEPGANVRGVLNQKADHTEGRKLEPRPGEQPEVRTAAQGDAAREQPSHRRV